MNSKSELLCALVGNQAMSIPADDRHRTARSVRSRRRDSRNESGNARIPRSFRFSKVSKIGQTLLDLGIFFLGVSDRDRRVLVRRGRP